MNDKRKRRGLFFFLMICYMKPWSECPIHIYIYIHIWMSIVNFHHTYANATRQYALSFCLSERTIIKTSNGIYGTITTLVVFIPAAGKEEL